MKFAVHIVGIKAIAQEINPSTHEFLGGKFLLGRKVESQLIKN